MFKVATDSQINNFHAQMISVKNFTFRTFVKNRIRCYGMVPLMV